MPSLATMKARIATELDRTDLTGPIASAITDAIAEFEQDRFYFNESRDLTFSTVAAQRIYTLSDAAWIATVIEIDELFVTVSGTIRCLRKESAEYIESMTDNSAASGEPYCYAYFDQSIQLYPVPGDAYTVRAVAHHRLDALASDADDNAWTNEGERLIRRRAKALLFAEMIGDANQAMANDVLAGDAYQRLMAESSRRRSTGIIKSSGF